MKSVASRPNPALKAKSLRPEVPVAGIGGPSLRLLTLLEWIGESDKPQTLSQIVAKLDEPKATVHRLLIGLEEMNYVQRLPGGRHYAPGPRLHQLAIKTLQHGHVSAVRHAILGRLVSEFNESCNLTILDGSEVIYLDRVEADWPLRMDLKPGARVPAYCSASGKMILALMDRSIREPLLRAIRYQAYTPQTITSPGVLETELDRIAARGYSIDQEEYTAGLNCLSVPVLDQAGKCLAAIAVHAPVARLTINTAVKKIDVMREAAREIAGTLETLTETEKDHAR